MYDSPFLSYKIRYYKLRQSDRLIICAHKLVKKLTNIIVCPNPLHYSIIDAIKDWGYFFG